MRSLGLLREDLIDERERARTSVKVGGPAAELYLQFSIVAAVASIHHVESPPIRLCPCQNDPLSESVGSPANRVWMVRGTSCLDVIESPYPVSAERLHDHR